jgi:hypothetical protein
MDLVMLDHPNSASSLTGLVAFSKLSPGSVLGHFSMDLVMLDHPNSASALNLNATGPQNGTLNSVLLTN